MLILVSRAVEIAPSWAKLFVAAAGWNVSSVGSWSPPFDPQGGPLTIKALTGELLGLGRRLPGQSPGPAELLI
jgi:hypothetical protein